MAIISPCTKVCTMESANGVCIGCGRTLDEIARWGGMDDAERRTIMARLGKSGNQVAERSRASSASLRSRP